MQNGIAGRLRSAALTRGQQPTTLIERSGFGSLRIGWNWRDRGTAPGATILAGFAKIILIALSWVKVPAAAAERAHHARTATKPIRLIPTTSPQCRPASAPILVRHFSGIRRLE